ncbi:MAG: DUF480 domain-containing protein [Planctomycetota bacterium]
MTEGGASRLEFNEVERRILGVLIEKGLTNPKTYPLSMSALLSGCNQRSNRDPITQYDESLLEDALERLQGRELATKFYPGEGGRVHRWRQDLGKMFGFRGVEMAVIGELFLRGAQSVGELRQRASRMRDIPTLPELDEILNRLIEHEPPFVVRLTPPGVSRGVRYTHACYEQGEMEGILEQERHGGSQGIAMPGPRGPSQAAVLERLDELERRVARIEVLLSSSADFRGEDPGRSDPAAQDGAECPDEERPGQ